MTSTLSVQLPWQRSGPGFVTTRRHSRVNASVFMRQQQDESGEDEEDGQHLRLEVPRLVSPQSDDRRQEGDSVYSGVRRAGGGGGVGGPREGDLDVMSATSSALGQVQASVSTISQRERRAQIDSCWCNIPNMFVDPASRAAYYWMALVTVAVIYNWIVIILRVAFEDMRDNDVSQKVFRVLDMISDVIYLMDVAIQSRTAYLEGGCLVKSLPETVRHYRSQPYFVLDVLSVVPVTTVISQLSKIGVPVPFRSGFNSLTTPGLRIFRLMKYPSMTRFFEKTDSRTNNPNLLRAFRLSLHLWLVIHWIGCFYYLLSRYEGLGINDWVYPDTAEFAAFRRKYIVCMYWSTMTLTTIGERPWPVTDLEYIFTGVTFLIGVFVFAAVVGNVGDVISNMNAARHDFQARMDQIKFFLNHRHVPEHLQDQIKRWAEYTWARTKAIDEHSVLQLLPNRLRTEVAIHVHLKTLKKVRIFEQCEEGLLRELVLKLRPSIYSPGEYICRIGEIGREMYIIDHGKVEILFPERGTGNMKQVAVMMAGNYFGEISLLKLDEGQNKRTADVRSVGFSELLCLSRRDLMAALMEYPEAKKILETQARQRMQQTKRSSSVTSDEPDLPANSEPSSAQRGSGFGSGSGSSRRSARAIFAQVMKQEGFSKLLASTANEELAEMRTILKELKEIKSQFSRAAKKQLGQQIQEMEHQLQRDQDLHEIRTQLLMQTDAEATPSNQTPSSYSNLTSPADPSSDTSTLTSPSVSKCLPLPPKVHARQTVPMVKPSSLQAHQLPLEHCMRHPPSDTKIIFPGAVPARSGHSAKVVKAMSPFGCSVLPENMVNVVRVLPAETTNPSLRRRRSSSSRLPKTMDTDQCPTQASGRPDGSLNGSSTVLYTTQNGGGDEPALLTEEKVPAEKDLDEERLEGIATKKSASSTSSFKSFPSIAASLSSAVGSHSSTEFIASLPDSSLKKQQGLKPGARGVSSEQFESLAQSYSLKSQTSGSTTSSYTDNSTTTSSSGGRGRSPKPAKPKPRYRTEDLTDDIGHTSTKNEVSTETSEREVHDKPRKGSDVVPDTDSGESAAVEGCVSSEGFSGLFVCTSLEEPDSASNSISKDCSHSPETGSVGVEQEHISGERAINKEDTSLLQMHTKTTDMNTACVPSLSEPRGEDMSSECTVSVIENVYEENSSIAAETAVEEPVCCKGQKDHDHSVSNVPADQVGDDLMRPEAADECEKYSLTPDPDCEEEHLLDASSDRDADSIGTFIAATRVKSDFDKRLSSKELASMPRTITCPKINDAQLSILLAKRRKVNDSADYTVESPGRCRLSSVNVGQSQAFRTDHSHSVHSVIKQHSAVNQCYGDESTQRAQENLSADNENQAPSYADVHVAVEQDGVNSKFSALPSVSVELHQQTDSPCHKVTYNENISSDYSGPAEYDGTETAAPVNKQDLQSQGCVSVNTSDKHRVVHMEDEFNTNRTYSSGGTDSSIAPASGRTVGGMKEKTYPISILKKCRPEAQPGSQPDNTNTQETQRSACPEMFSSCQGPVWPTAPVADDSYTPPASLAASDCPDSSILPEEEDTTALSLDLHEDKSSDSHSELKPSKGDLPAAEYESSDCLYDSRKRSKFQRRNRNREVTLLHHMRLLKIKDDLDLDKLSQSASAGTTVPVNPCDMTDNLSDQSHVVPSLQASRSAPIYEKEDEDLSALRRRYSALRYRRQNLDKAESISPSGVCVNPGSAPSVPEDEVLTVNASRPSGVISSTPCLSTRKHSEKLDSLIAAFENAVNVQEEEDLTVTGAENNTISYPETTIASPTSTENDKVTPVEKDKENPLDKDKVDHTETDKASESMGDSTSLAKCYSPKLQAVGNEDETKGDNTMLLTPNPVATLPQKRKTLRRRILSKRVSIPYGRKEGLHRNKMSSHSIQEVADLGFPIPNPKSQMERTMSVPELQTEGISTSVTLLKNLVWEMDTGRPPCSGLVGETQLCTSKDDSLLPSQVQTEVICSSPPSEASSQEFSQCCSTLQTNFTGSVNSCINSTKTKSGEDLSVDEPDIINDTHVEVPAITKALSFKDKIKEAADRLRPSENLDKANNSTTTFPQDLSSSGSSSPSGSIITKSVCTSYFPGKHASLELSDMPIVEHICYEAPYDMNQINPSTSVHTSPSSVEIDTGHFHTKCHEKAFDTEVENLSHILRSGAGSQNGNHSHFQENNSKAAHSSMAHVQLAVTTEDASERLRASGSNTVAPYQHRLQSNILAKDQSGMQPGDESHSQQAAARSHVETVTIHQGQSSSDTNPLHLDPENVARGTSVVTNRWQPENAENVLETEQFENEPDQETVLERARGLIQEVSDEELVTGSESRLSLTFQGERVSHAHHERRYSPTHEATQVEDARRLVRTQSPNQEATQEENATLHEGYRSLSQETTTETLVSEMGVDSSIVTSHLSSGLLDSAGASSTDDGAGEEDEEAEDMGSFIFLADFGVDDDDDDEGALSGLSGCDDRSDITSDLDDL